jgi:hypothetical protein
MYSTKYEPDQETLAGRDATCSVHLWTLPLVQVCSLLASKLLENFYEAVLVSFTHPWEIQPPRFMLLVDSHGATHPARERRRPCSAGLEKE